MNRHVVKLSRPLQFLIFVLAVAAAMCVSVIAWNWMEAAVTWARETCAAFNGAPAWCDSVQILIGK